jgi:hypothetical protein
MKSARKENKFLFLTSLFQNLANEENCQRAESVMNLIKKETEIKSNKREDKKNENKKNDQNNDNNHDKKNKCTKCDRVNHSNKKCLTINSE